MKKQAMTEKEKMGTVRNLAALIIVDGMGGAAEQVDKVPVVGRVISAPIKLVTWGIGKIMTDDGR